MATTTPNYGLHQWEYGELPARSELNKALLKVDTAIKAVASTADSGMDAADKKAQRALNTLEAMGYNIYNLLLEHDYAGQSTQFKKGVLFDGFRDQSRISTLTGAVWDASHPSLLLDGAGQQNVTQSYGLNGPSGVLVRKASMDFDWTATGNGTLTGITLCMNGLAKVEFLQGSATLGTYSMTTVGREPTIPFSVPVTAGVTYTFRLTNISTSENLSYWSDGSLIQIQVGYKLTFTPRITTSGSVISTAAQLEGSSACLWVRHQGGTITPALRQGSGTWYSMTKTGARTTVNAKGISCTESAFTLSRALSGSLSVRLTLSTSSGQTARVYDYGILFF